MCSVFDFRFLFGGLRVQKTQLMMAPAHIRDLIYDTLVGLDGDKHAEHSGTETNLRDLMIVRSFHHDTSVADRLCGVQCFLKCY